MRTSMEMSEGVNSECMHFVTSSSVLGTSNSVVNAWMSGAGMPFVMSPNVLGVSDSMCLADIRRHRLVVSTGSECSCGWLSVNDLVTLIASKVGLGEVCIGSDGKAGCCRPPEGSMLTKPSSCPSQLPFVSSAPCGAVAMSVLVSAMVA